MSSISECLCQDCYNHIVGLIHYYENIVKSTRCVDGVLILEGVVLHKSAISIIICQHAYFKNELRKFNFFYHAQFN